MLTDSRWDMTYLGMQVLIEGLALAAFASIRDQAKNPLAAAVNAYVMQDEARHVAFGRLALRDYYPQLTQTERDEREEFAIEACYLMRDRFLARSLGDARAAGRGVRRVRRSSAGLREFRSRLFSRIVPTIKDIGLWGPKIRAPTRTWASSASPIVDPDAVSHADELAALEIDRARVAPEVTARRHA